MLFSPCGGWLSSVIKSVTGKKDSASKSRQEKMPNSFETEKDVVSAIDGLVCEIAGNQELAAFFAKSLRDLRELKDRIENHDTRVAIIGITSSGKSTLMNAVLGAQMLPTRVGPSSSKQVLCGWDKVAEGEIVFSPETGKPIRRIKGGAKQINETLEKYGDERFNPGNREQVDEIRVHAPGFRFNRELIIIDTPGLDAYGLDQHKEVTMKLVLPTVDMVLFLTNVKCDSDAKNLEFIDNVTSDEKPLIVVQNKIDSIEPKISRQGVEKTVEQIRVEHRNRLKKLLSNAKKESVRNAPVVQVSAKAPKWEDTNLAELGRVLDEQIRINSGARLGRRVRQLSVVVEEMSEALRAKLEEGSAAEAARKKAQEKLDGWRRALEGLKKTGAEVQSEINARVVSIRDTREDLLKTIDREYLASDVSGFRGLLSFDEKKYRRTESLSSSVLEKKKALEDSCRDFNAVFSASISRVQNETAECCRTVGVDETKTIRRSVFRSANVSISAAQKTVSRNEVYRVKKSGLFGGCARLFGSMLGHSDWGYETRQRTVTSIEYDIEELVKQINAAYRSFASAVEGQISTFAQNTDFALGVLSQEVRDKSTAVEAQRKQSLSMEGAHHVENVLSELKRVSYRQSAQEIANADDGSALATPERCRFREIVVPAYVKALVDYAHQFSFEAAYAVFDSVVRRAGAKNVVVCGWDGEKLSRFATYFLRSGSSARVVDFSDGADCGSGDDTVAFVLVNAEQAGSFRGKLFGGGAGSKFVNNVLRSSGKVVWVMDSVREHVSVRSADSFVDACMEMFAIIRDAQDGRATFEVMACDRELYWSAILHEMYFNEMIRKSDVSLQKCVAEISTLFHLASDRRNATGHYLAQFKTRKGQ